jgi:hypothetical protein
VDGQNGKNYMPKNADSPNITELRDFLAISRMRDLNTDELCFESATKSIRAAHAVSGPLIAVIYDTHRLPVRTLQLVRPMPAAHLSVSPITILGGGSSVGTAEDEPRRLPDTRWA